MRSPREWTHLKKLSCQLHFMNPPMTFVLLLQRVLQITNGNIHANNIQDVILMFLLVNTMVQDCFIRKMYIHTQWLYYGSSC